MKDLFTPALGTALGVSIAVAVAVGLFLVAQRLLGFFSYSGLTSVQIDKVAHKYLGNVVTKADGPDYSRGVINTGGSLYYFSWHYGKSFEVYPLVMERYQIDKSILDNPHLVLPV